MSAIQAIESALNPLIGLKLVHTSRAADMQCFHFSSSEWEVCKVTKSFWSLHIQCPWRICDETRIVVGHTDMYEPVEEDAPYDESFNWDVKGGNLRDAKLAFMMQSPSPLVQTVAADALGGLEMRLEQGLVLSAFPTLTRKHDYGEYWRVFNASEEDSAHFVASAREISRL